MKKDEDICVVFQAKNVNRVKEVVIYTEVCEDDGNVVFTVDYDIQYSNGECKEGCAMVDLADVLKVYNASSFKEVADGLKSRYENDENAWQKIVAEMKEKGLDVCDYEDESCDF